MNNKVEDIVKKYVESIRPKDAEVRKELDFDFSYDGKIVIMYEVRPVWNDPSKIQHLPYVKIRYYKSRQEWNLYWMRASGKWELYRPFPSSKDLQKIIRTIDEDAYGCFYG